MDCDNGGCHLSPSQFRFAFAFGGQYFNCKIIMFVNLLILSLLYNASFGESGVSGL